MLNGVKVLCRGHGVVGSLKLTVLLAGVQTSQILLLPTKAQTQ